MNSLRVVISAAILLILIIAPRGNGHVFAFPGNDEPDGAIIFPDISADRNPSQEKQRGAPSGPLTLSEAVSLALTQNQDLAAANRQIEADKAAAIQAGILPNPELEVAIENFGGSNGLSGFGGAETTTSLSQLIQLGGKRHKRKKAATLGADATALKYQKTRLAIIAETTKAFYEVAAAQEKASLATEQEQLAEEVFKVVQARVEAGKVSPIEATKAQVILSKSRIGRDKARQELKVGLNNLAAFWGSDTPSFVKVSGHLDNFDINLPPFEELINLAMRHPAIEGQIVKIEQAKAELRLARAARFPDINVGGGVRNFQETNDNALVASVSMPLMLFDWNQGGIKQATHRLAAKRAALKSAKIKARTELNKTYKNLVTAFAEAKILKNEALPSARTVFETVREGYQFGKFSYLDVLDSQRTLFDVTADYIDTLLAFQTAVTEVKQLAALETTGATRDNTEISGN